MTVSSPSPPNPPFLLAFSSPSHSRTQLTRPTLAFTRTRALARAASKLLSPATRLPTNFAADAASLSLALAALLEPIKEFDASFPRAPRGLVSRTVRTVRDLLGAPAAARAAALEAVLADVARCVGAAAHVALAMRLDPDGAYFFPLGFKNRPVEEGEVRVLNEGEVRERRAAEEERGLRSRRLVRVVCSYECVVYRGGEVKREEGEPKRGVISRRLRKATVAM